jgi:hypothetical protein
VLAGVAIAIVVQVLLAILGGALGLAFVDPTESNNPELGTITIIATIWWVLSGILAAWAGGVTAGRLSGRPGTTSAAWHGLVAWAATTLVIFYLITTAIGGVVGGAFGALGGVASTAADAAANVVPAVAESADPFSRFETNIDDAIGVNDPAAARSALTAMVSDAFTAEGDAAGPAMDRAVDAFARATGTSPDEARAQLTAWQEEYQEAVATAEAEAREAADAARKAASAAGLVSVIALIFGALAGWFGGLNSPLPDRDSLLGSGFGRRVTAAR